MLPLMIPKHGDCVFAYLEDAQSPESRLQQPGSKSSPPESAGPDLEAPIESGRAP
ncbi:MAG: hypothetical protein AB7K09_02405 [Planctomycetota bacterium]